MENKQQEHLTNVNTSKDFCSCYFGDPVSCDSRRSCVKGERLDLVCGLVYPLLGGDIDITSVWILKENIVSSTRTHWRFISMNKWIMLVPML